MNCNDYEMTIKVISLVLDEKNKPYKEKQNYDYAVYAFDVAF